MSRTSHHSIARLVKPNAPSAWRAACRERILFHERYRFLRLPYLFYRALLALGPTSAFTYLRAKLRRKHRSAEPVCIPVGRGLNVSLRDCHTDLAIFEQVMLLGDLLPGKTGAQPAYIIDAGAHIGCSSVYYALKFPDARILAIEAEGSNYRQLCRNAADIPAIRPLHAAVFHRSGHVVVTNPGDQPWGFQVGGAEDLTTDHGQTIRAMTLDELISLSGFPHIDVLKLDIEGSEREIFAAGGQSWLPLVRLITIELHDRIKPGCTQSFEQAVCGMPHELIKTLNNVIWINRSVP